MTSRPERVRHTPVGRDRVATIFVHHSGQLGDLETATKSGQRYLDANLGHGGHSDAILEFAPDAEVHAFEVDPEAEARAREYLGPDKTRQITVHRTSFANLEATLAPLGLMGTFAGAIVDPGLSIAQATEGDYGFSFMKDGPLRMTFDPAASPTAAEFLATADTATLTALFIANDIPARDAGKVADAIVKRSRTAPLATTHELRDLITDTLGRTREGKRHAATRYFQAIRTAVTHELDDLEAMLPQMLRALAIGGVGVLLSYQGAEAKIEREFLKTYKRKSSPDAPTSPRLEVLTPRAEKPSREEIRQNPAARSALLRAFRRIA